MRQNRQRKRKAFMNPALFLPAAIAVVIGAGIGLGTFTFGYGEGLSYFSTDPAACANCHVMQSYYDSWQKSSHHHVAGCVDCHLPHDFVGKYAAKADNGFFHSMAFTLDNFPEPIQIKKRNRAITQHNCVQCHQAFVDNLLPANDGGDMLACIQCHTDVGHGPRSGGVKGPGR